MIDLNDLKLASARCMALENGYLEQWERCSLLQLLASFSKEASLAKFQRLVRASIFASFLVMIICGVVIVWTVGPWIENKFFPVVDKLVMSDIHEDPDAGETTFTAAFTKLRNCEYLGLGWYQDMPTSDQRVNVTLRRSVKDKDGPSRPPGFTLTGPWTVELSLNQLLNHSHAVLYHRCHPFWVSTTDFYP